MDHLFEQASRKRLVFATKQGTLTVEDLWDLPLTSVSKASLDEIARSLHKKLNTESVSFVEAKPTENEGDRLGFEIVKHIIAVRLEENKKTAEARLRKEQKQRIMELIAKKQDQALEGKSEEELNALLATL